MRKIKFVEGNIYHIFNRGVVMIEVRPQSKQASLKNVKRINKNQRGNNRYLVAENVFGLR